MSRIIIVDDDPAQRARWKHTLESSGHTIITAPDAIQGLINITRDPPDLILSDILMPRMDGFTFIREVKSRPDLRTIPFLFVTSTLVSEEDRQFAQMLGAEAIIARANENAEIQDIINAALKRHQRKAPPDPAPTTADANETIIHTMDAPAPRRASFAAPIETVETPAPREADATAQARVHELERINAELAARVDAESALAGERDRVLEKFLTQTEKLQARLHAQSLFVAALNEIAQALNQNLDPEPILERIVEHAAALTHADWSAIFLFNAETAAFNGAYAAGIDRGGIRQIILNANGAVESLLHEKSARALCPTLPYLSETIFPVALNAQAVIVAPIIAHQEVFGLLVCAATTADREFSADELQITAQFAEQAGVALGNARLLYKTRRAPAADDAAPNLARYRAQIAALSEIARPVADTLSPRQVLQQIARSAKQLARVETVNLFLFNSDTRTFNGVASSSLPLESIQKMHYAADNNGAMLNVMQNHAPLAWRGSDDAAEEIPMLDAAFRARAALVVPLVARGETLGVMLCVDSTSQRVFSDEDIELLTTLANQAALWLEAAHWYYEANRAQQLASPRRAQMLDQIKETTLGLSEPLVAALDQIRLTLEQSPSAETRLRLEGIDANTRRVVELVDHLRRLTQTPLYLDD